MFVSQKECLFFYLVYILIKLREYPEIKFNVVFILINSLQSIFFDHSLHHQTQLALNTILKKMNQHLKLHGHMSRYVNCFVYF